MKLPSPGFLLDATLRVCRRFPAAMLCTVFGVVAVFALIDEADDDFFLRTWMICQLGLPLMAGIVVWSESKRWDDRRAWLLQGLGLLCLLGYWFLLHPEADSFEYEGLPPYVVLLVTAHLLVAVAPYLNSRPVRDFWEYNRELFANIVIGAVFTLILYAGLALAILAVDQLFDLDINGKSYIRLFVLLAGIFNTVYFLFHFPHHFEFEATDAAYNAAFKNLCKYILIPIVGLYFLILYAYSGKIVTTWSLPRGWVSSLVLGFSVAGIFTYLLNFYLPEYDGSTHVRVYKRWFWWVLLPLTLLLFIAIGKRIGDYGVTEPRFLVAHLGVWLLATCLYFLLSRHDNLKFIPVSLGIFGLFYAFGPFNALKVSERSQEGILKKILEKNGRWENGRLTRGTTDMTEEEARRALSILYYLDRRDALRRMEWLPMPVDSFPQTSGVYDTPGRIAEWAGIKGDAQGLRGDFFNVVASEPYAPLDVRGFRTGFPIELFGSNTNRPNDGYFFDISGDGKFLDWEEAKAGQITLVETFDLQPVLRKWVANARDTYIQLSPSESVFDLHGRKATIRVSIRNADIKKEAGDLKLQHLNGYLLLKEK